jgi:hypothetical protein
VTTLRAAFDELPHGCHELLSMLVSDPPSSYADISATLGAAMGSIGPTQSQGAPATAFPADEIGCFSIAPIPASPFRLYCRTAAGVDAVTGWVTL